MGGKQGRGQGKGRGDADGVDKWRYCGRCGCWKKSGLRTRLPLIRQELSTRGDIVSRRPMVQLPKGCSTVWNVTGRQTALHFHFYTEYTPPPCSHAHHTICINTHKDIPHHVTKLMCHDCVNFLKGNYAERIALA